MKYRDHKGNLLSSMDTVQEVNSIEEIKQYLNKFYNQFGKNIVEIKFEYSCFDVRINWDTYLVLFRLDGESEFKIAGYSDGILLN